MSRIQALDEITARLGPPAFLRWVDAPYGAAAAVVRLRHRGAVVDLSASRAFRLIFQLSSSQVARDATEAAPSRDMVRAGNIITSFTERAERIRIFGSADTLHLLFSPDLAAACEVNPMGQLPLARRELQATAVQTLVATSFGGTDAQLQQTVASVARLVVEGHTHEETKAGGLAPQARCAMLDLLEKRLAGGVSVPELADAANLSLHHFIKACRQSEGLTPHALLMQKRIERSIELLLSRTATVDEVATLVGFSSPSHFISTFRRMVGVTPASLRRAARS
jgi:AraC family transcriptional regulator